MCGSSPSSVILAPLVCHPRGGLFTSFTRPPVLRLHDHSPDGRDRSANGSEPSPPRGKPFGWPHFLLAFPLRGGQRPGGALPDREERAVDEGAFMRLRRISCSQREHIAQGVSLAYRAGARLYIVPLLTGISIKMPPLRKGRWLSTVRGESRRDRQKRERSHSFRSLSQLRRQLPLRKGAFWSAELPSPSPQGEAEGNGRSLSSHLGAEVDGCRAFLRLRRISCSQREHIAQANACISLPF